MKQLAITFAITLAACGFATAADWLQFRGATSNSATRQEQLDIDWTLPNLVIWSSPLPGKGPSSPIVVGDRVFVTASSGVNQDRLHVLCFDEATGKQLWERQFWATGRTITHPSSANAAPTPASDGKRIFAFFSSNDLAALDLDGNLLWYRGLAIDNAGAGNDVGMSSSPVVVGNSVIVQIENQSNSFAAGIDAATGKTNWRVDRALAPSWTSPIAVRGAKPEDDFVLLQSSDRLTAHDPASGRELWMHKAGCEGIPSAAAADGVVYVPSEGITALDTKTSATAPTVAWKAGALQPGAASPLVHDGRLYIVNRGGVLSCADAKTGEVLWRLRLEGSFWSTPALAGNQMVCCADSGLMQIVGLTADGSAGSVIGKVDLGEKIQSSPALSHGAVFVRSDGHLYKIGVK